MQSRLPRRFALALVTIGTWILAGCPSSGGGGGGGGTGNGNDNGTGNMNTNGNVSDNENVNDNVEPGDSGLTGKFVGAARCAGCHSDTHSSWMATAHAGALEALEAIGQGANQECIGCHTVGFGEEGGFVDRATTNSLAGVQCENCHGAAGDHVASGGGEPFPTVTVSAQVCGACHTEPHHPTFDEWSLSKHSMALATLQENAHANDDCLQCHSQDYRYALELQADGDEDVVVPVLDAAAENAAQFSLECVTCHNPHQKGAGDPPSPPSQLRMAIADLCGECHTEGDVLPGGTPHHPQLEMAEGAGAFDANGDALTVGFSPHSSLFSQGGQACAQCHVVKHEFDDPNEGNPNVTGHTFNPFDEEITALSPEHQPAEYNGCEGCHTAEVADEHRTRVQSEILARLDALAPFFDATSDQFIDPEDANLSADDQARLASAAFNFHFVQEDKSNGVHNSFYARAALDVADEVTADLSGG